MDASPRRIDDFTLGPLLGEGLTGRTYVATAASANGHLRQVALKLVHPERAALRPWVTALGREQDAHLVRYEAVGRRTPEWSGWLATDLVCGRDHATLLDVPYRDRLALVRGAAEAVATLHARRRPLTHGCLKPSNVVVRRERSGALVPLVIDAGVVPRYDPAFHDAPAQAARLYPWLAPEALEAFRSGAGLPESPAADVYSLGALLCSLLTGRAPGGPDLDADPDEVLAAKRRRYTVHALLDPEEGIDGGILDRVLGRTLAPDPGERPTALWVADALQACLTPRRAAPRVKEPA